MRETNTNNYPNVTSSSAHTHTQSQSQKQTEMAWQRMRELAVSGRGAVEYVCLCMCVCVRHLMFGFTALYFLLYPLKMAIDFYNTYTQHVIFARKMTNSQKVFHPNDNHLRQSSFHMCNQAAPLFRFEDLKLSFSLLLCCKYQQHTLNSIQLYKRTIYTYKKCSYIHAHAHSHPSVRPSAHPHFILFFSVSHFYVIYLCCVRARMFFHLRARLVLLLLFFLLACLLALFYSIFL